jgi:hypothetical protein
VLTIFSCPKPFRGHIKTIQTNAIKSWTLLEPKPEVILIGDDEGTADICCELGIRHIPEVGRNEYGTPLLNSLFEIVQSAAKYDLFCYVNADIILLRDFIQAVRQTVEHFGGNAFLISGRRWNLDVNTDIDFSRPDWDLRLRSDVLSKGALDRHGAMDYFVFPRGLYSNMPALILGRCSWDNWMLHRALSQRLPLVDASEKVIIVHQRHDYAHTPFNKKSLNSVISGPEVRINKSLCRGGSRFITLLDATAVFSNAGFRRPGLLRFCHRYALRMKMYTWYVLAEVLYPYSWPLIFLIRGLKRVVELSAVPGKFRLRRCR